MSIESGIIVALVFWSLFLGWRESVVRRERDRIKAAASKLFEAQDFVDRSDLGYEFPHDPKWREAYRDLKFETL